MSITIDELMQKVKAFCELCDWYQFHGPKDQAIGVITEVAGFLAHFRFQSEEQALTLLNDPQSDAP